VVRNYYSLPAFVGFTQGSIAGHEWVRKDWGADMFWNMLVEAQKTGCSNASYTNPLENHPDWGYTFDAAKQRDPKYRRPGVSESITLKQWMVQHDLGMSSRLHYYPGAFMVIKREKILQRPLEYFVSLLATMNTSSGYANGFLMERSWYYIFGCHMAL
jgi:hypothetical protein